MRKGNVDWKPFCKSLLWMLVLRHKNEESIFDIYTTGGCKGEIGSWRFSSAIGGEFKPLTWKELALELGLFTDLLTDDGHDCTKCPDEKNCKAGFKYDKDHECCGWWTKHYKVPVPTDVEDTNDKLTIAVEDAEQILEGLEFDASFLYGIQRKYGDITLGEAIDKICEEMNELL